MAQEYIAVLGYGENCSEQNKSKAFQAGHEIASHGLAVCAGNVSGTFHSAFKGAKSISGRTIAILEVSKKGTDASLCDEIFYTTDTDTKHQLIAEKSLGAIVIGGGEGTNNVISKLLSMGKTVVAILNTGGAADSKSDARVKIETDIKEAINLIIKGA